MKYPEFVVPGVPPEETWQLFNVSNYPYYLQKIKDIIAGICPFCTIDPAVNKVLFQNVHWLMWANKMAPRSGQDHQFIFPLRRHVQRLDEVTTAEWATLQEIIFMAEQHFNVHDGALVIRSGDPLRNAKSVPHFHVNYHVPTGRDRVEVTIGKSEDDLAKKRAVLRIFEQLRQLELANNSDPMAQLGEAERAMVESRLGGHVFRN